MIGAKSGLIQMRFEITGRKCTGKLDRQGDERCSTLCGILWRKGDWVHEHELIKERVICTHFILYQITLELKSKSTIFLNRPGFYTTLKSHFKTMGLPLYSWKKDLFRTVQTLPLRKNILWHFFLFLVFSWLFVFINEIKARHTTCFPVQLEQIRKRNSNRKNTYCTGTPLYIPYWKILINNLMNLKQLH